MIGRALFRSPKSRAAPIDIIPTWNRSPGSLVGIGGEADAEIMLRETQGVPSAATRAIANRISALDPQVVIKRRASPIEPEAVWRQLQPYLVSGAAYEATLVFTRIGDRRLAFLCEATTPTF